MKILVLGCLLMVSAVSAEKPNVVVVITDDQGYGDMSCHGNPVLKTPQMDRLHGDGVRLTDFHVDPTCSPSRAALMTGRYSSRAGVWLTFSSRHHLRRDEVTMADVFRANGYRTGIFGKWHLGDNYPFRVTDRGFDESFVHGGGVIGETPDWWDNNYYDDMFFRNNVPERAKGYCTDVWIEEAMEFVERNRERPFFAYVSANAPHGPLHVPESYRKPYEGEGAKRAAFYGMIASIDENLGKLRGKLEELKLERDTIVVFLNDNGTNGGVGLAGDGRNGWAKSGFNAGMRGRKCSAYEGGHRAACFIHWPAGGLDGGRDVGGVTAHIDLLPTFIELCGLEFPGGMGFDGTSLAKALKTGETPDRTLVVHHQGRFGSPVEDGLLIKGKDYAVMSGRWRLVGKELYDLEGDPGQRKDVAAAHPEVVKRMQAEYEGWWRSISERGRENCPFVINPAKQKVVLVSAQNLLGGNVAYSQRSVRKAEGGEYGWAFIDVEVPGSYKIGLRRWPRESGLAIRAEAPEYPQKQETHMMAEIPCRVLEVVKARLQVGGFDQTVEVGEADEEVVFEVELEKGEQKIQTWFTMKDGDERAAYYTYIEAK